MTLVTDFKVPSLGQPVHAILDGAWTAGETISEASPSPELSNPSRMVIRVRWEDGEESIEPLDKLVY
jgi:hypothetical protein